MSNKVEIGEGITPKMKESVMYKLSYYKFWDVYSQNQKGYDKARKSKIGYANFQLKYFEEVYTSIRWMI